MITELKPYPVMKPSGVEWLGDVPEHWEMVRLRGCASNVTDQTRDVEPDEPYVALEHVQSWTGRIREAVTGGATDSQLKRFQAGDVLFGKLRPYLAKVARARSSGVCVGEFLVLRPRGRELSASYVEHVLRSRPVIDAVNASTFGAKMPRADWRFIGDLRIPLPPRVEQEAIVRYLDYADRQISRYIRAKQSLIELLEEEKQVIIHRAVTRGLDAGVRLKPSGVDWLGDVPEHWEVARLGSLLHERGETNKDGAVTHVLSLLRHRGVIPYDQKGRIGNKKSEDITRYKVVRPDDIVMNCMNVIIGSVGLSSYTGCLSPVYYVLVARHGNNPRYLDAIFQVPTFHRSLIKIGNGILAHRMRIPMELLKCELLPRPPAEEQMAIVRHLDHASANIDTTISRALREIELLGEYRTRLIADVVTGKLDVREAAATLPEVDPADLEAIIEIDDAAADELVPELEEVAT